MNAIVFGGLALAGVSRLLAAGATGRTVGHVVALVLIALLGYRYAESGKLSRIWGILAFAAGWFWVPIVPLLGLVALARLNRAAEGPSLQAEPDAANGPLTAPAMGVAGDGAAIETEASHEAATALLTMKAAAAVEGSIRALGARFLSPHGEGVVPVLAVDERGEHGIYVESGPWDAAKEEKCLRWLGALRTSDKEELRVEVRSDTEVPERVIFYTGREPRVLFELLGLMHVRLFEEPGFGRENAATLKRLAGEYLDLDVPDGIPGLEVLDRVVVDVLRPDGHILPSTVLLLGSFFGETLVSEFDGRWAVRGATTDDVTVVIPSAGGRMNASVFGKVMKLFHNGMEDSTAWMARAIGERVRDGPTGGT